MNVTGHFADRAPQNSTSPEDWVEAHGDYLFNFALGQLRDASAAEDLVQDTFLAAFKAREGFTGGSSERTWLVGILRHKICDHLRRTCRERAVRAEIPDAAGDVDGWSEAALWLHEIAAESQSPSRRLELAEFRAQLEIALGQLPPRLAQAFQLHAIDEQPKPEVCRRLSVSESNFWVMLHRACKNLRGQLGAWWHDEQELNRRANSFPI